MMKGLVVWVAVAVVLGAGFVVARAWGEGEGSGMKGMQGMQATPAAPEKGTTQGWGCCPMVGAKGGPAAGGMMSGPMMMRCRMMMGAELTLADPSAVLALGEELGLSKEQVTKLQGIVARARNEAEAVLTADQRKKLAQVPAAPASMMQMCQRMMKQMSAGGKGEPMMCPMMQGSTTKAPAGTHTKQAK